MISRELISRAIVSNFDELMGSKHIVNSIPEATAFRKYFLGNYSYSRNNYSVIIKRYFDFSRENTNIRMSPILHELCCIKLECQSY